MPVASSSRRRSRREPSQDQIEEDEPSQRMDEDDVDDEEEHASRRLKKVKSEKRTGKQRQREQEEEDNAKPVDDDEPIDVDNFPDHPIDKKESQRLIGLAQDWSNIRKNMHRGSYNLVKDVGASMAEVTSGDASVKALSELDLIMKDLIDVEAEMLAHEKTIEDLHQVIAQEIPVTDSVDRYEKGVKATLNAYRNKTTRQKYAKSEEYAQFKQRIWEVENPDKGMPPINDFIPKESGDVSDDDDDLEIGGATQDFKCPLSLTMLVEPYTSTLCEHSFSKKAIIDYIRGSGGEVTCPTSGCKKVLTLGVVKPNKDLEKRVKAVVRRQQRQAEDSGDEDVIE
ncbi:hypothetical protein PLICRDRAFT_43627 [Plicaturopsis crispa FD-325 SS-3]|nr:hypothetical protein PLICRDRAFT_43627 [Plicaturopsis crispa FD-325 SS-3]